MNNWLDKKEFGVRCEELASDWLAGHGWQILERNVRFREGEIDIVTEREGRLRFVEVKGRRSKTFGGVVEALTPEKLRRMRRAIWKWRERAGEKRPGEIWFIGILVERDGTAKIEEFLVE